MHADAHTLFQYPLGKLHSQYRVCELDLLTPEDIVANTQFHKFYGRSFARVLNPHEGYSSVTPLVATPSCYPWLLPGSTGRFSITILCTETI